MRHVVYLAGPALAGRGAGTPGEEAAAHYVEAELTHLGLTPAEQPVEGGSRNVWARLDGRAPGVIVVGAHIDHLGVQDGAVYPGADDDASGVAVVLGIAAELSARRAELGRSIVFAFFGSEELGMVGSRRFVAEPPFSDEITAMVNVDMIGRPLLDQARYLPLERLIGIDPPRSVGLVGARHHPALRKLADDAFAAEHIKIVAAEDLPPLVGDEVERESEGRGDSVSFEEHGIPALFFGDGESTDYHRPTDTIDKVTPALLETRARAIASVVIALSNAPPDAFTESAARPPLRDPAPGWYLPVGFTNALVLGEGERDGNASYALGGRIALARLFGPSLAFAGIVADAVWDIRARAARAGAGIALGLGAFGVEGNVLFTRSERGWSVRPFVSLAAVTIGARVGVLGGAWFSEIGLDLQLPLRL
jgi:hypothetical protein